MKKTIFEEMGGTYIRHGDYLIPCLTLPEKERQRFIGVWGQRYLCYLKEYRRGVYLNLLISGGLNDYLTDSDIYVLIVLQSLLVSLLASLSRRDMSLDTAKEFTFSVSGVVGVRYGLRLVAQQGTKFINAIWPDTGSAVSAAIVRTGTNGIEKTTIAYYIDEKSIEDARAKLDEVKGNKDKNK